MQNFWVAGVSVLAALAWPDCAGASSRVPGHGPLMHAALAHVVELQAAPAPHTGRARDDWSRVVKLSPGEDVILTVRGLPAAAHRLLRTSDEGVTILDVGRASLPRDVLKALTETAAESPFTLLAARNGAEQLNRRVRVSPSGVYLGDQFVAHLSDVLKDVSRESVVEVRVRRKHFGSHMRRGVLIGAAVGATVAASSSGGCRSGCNVAGLAALGALGGAVVGLEIGTIAGLVAPRSPDVIYHVD